MTRAEYRLLIIPLTQQCPQITQQRFITLLRLHQQHLLKSPTHCPSRLSLPSDHTTRIESSKRVVYPLHCIRRSLIILASAELNDVGGGSHCFAIVLPFLGSGGDFFD